MSIPLATYRRGSLAEADSPSPAGTVPLVLLHGFPLDSRMWEPVAAALDDLPVVLVDLPGAGRSPLLPPASLDPAADGGLETLPDDGLTAPPASLDSAADGVLEALADQGFSRFVLAGLSMGGYVAMAILARAPAALAGIGLVSTNAQADDLVRQADRLAIAQAVLTDGGPERVMPMAVNLLGRAAQAGRPDLVAQMRQWISQARPETIAWSQRAMAARPQSIAVLSRSHLPAAVVVGADDAPGAVQRADEMRQALAQGGSDVTLTVLPQAGHMTALEEPEAVAAALRDLFRRSQTQRS